MLRYCPLVEVGSSEDAKEVGWVGVFFAVLFGEGRKFPIN